MKPIKAAILSATVALGLGASVSHANTIKSEAPINSYILLDRTGSMEDIWNEALSSVNSYAEELASLEGGPKVDADITVAVFDAQDGLQFDLIRKNVDADHWKSVSNDDATPRGMTPLYDAIGRMVSIAEQDKPEKAVIVIMTDGHENASRETTRTGAKAALDRARDKGWEVVFLGAEFADFGDAVGVGQSSSRNMAVSKEQLSDSMNRLARKSKAYANGQEATIEWNEEDRAAAEEEQVKNRTGQR